MVDIAIDIFNYIFTVILIMTIIMKTVLILKFIPISMKMGLTKYGMMNQDILRMKLVRIIGMIIIMNAVKGRICFYLADLIM